MRSSCFRISPLMVVVGFALSCEDGKPDDTAPILDTSDTCEDVDGDGYCGIDDCDDSDAAVNPGAMEACDGIDNDCDGELDEGTTSAYYADNDEDGFGTDEDTVDACDTPSGYVPVDGDCDDDDPDVYPGQTEDCDGVDNDCDGTIDNDMDWSPWFADADGDTYGNPDDQLDACDTPPGYVDNDWDCDDANAMEPLHVATDGDDSNSGTYEEPLEHVQTGIDTAESCVFLLPGEYVENIDFNGSNVFVRGLEGFDSTTINGSGGGSTVTFDSGETEDAGMTEVTITGGTGTAETEETSTECGSPVTGDCTATTLRYYGGGIYINGASPTLYNVVVTANNLPGYSYTMDSSTSSEEYVYSYGGGIFMANTTMSMDLMQVSTNFADNGGGIYANSDTVVTMTHSAIDANSASSGGGMTTAGVASLTNCVVVNNTASGVGGGIGGAGLDVTGGASSVTNITAVGNDGTSSVYLSGGSALTVANSILADNDDGYLVDGESGTTLAVSYTDVYNDASMGSGGTYGAFVTDPTGTDGNGNWDPEFVDWSDNLDHADDDLNLAEGSLSIDAGNPDSAYNDTDGSANDQGVFGGPDGGPWY